MAAVVEMLGGVSMRRAVAAADVAAHEAEPQVDPVGTDLKALFASLKRVRRHRLGDRIEVPALIWCFSGPGRHKRFLRNRRVRGTREHTHDCPPERAISATANFPGFRRERFILGVTGKRTRLPVTPNQRCACLYKFQVRWI